MRGGYQADVVCALLLQAQEGIRQFSCGERFSVQVAADLIVLAEAAAQRASAEKYGAASVFAADAGFFPEVQGSAGRNCAVRGLAETALYRPVNATHARAETAVMDLVFKIRKR